MLEGAEAAKYDVIMFVDADLISIRKEHILYPLTYITKDLADMVIAIRDKDLYIFKYLSGERAIRKSLFLKLVKERNIRHLGRGLEAYLNKKLQNKRVCAFHYPGLRQTGKREDSYTKKLLQTPDYLLEFIEHLEAFINLKFNKSPLITSKIRKLRDKAKKLLKTLTV